MNENTEFLKLMLDDCRYIVEKYATEVLENPIEALNNADKLNRFIISSLAVLDAKDGRLPATNNEFYLQVYNDTIKIIKEGVNG